MSQMEVVKFSLPLLMIAVTLRVCTGAATSTVAAAAAQQTYPYILNIRDANSTRGCGASLITPKCALTAGHCMEHENDDSLSVYATHDDNPKTHERQIEKIILPDDFLTSRQRRGSVSDVDVAVLLLKEPFTENEAKPIEIVYNSPPAVGDAITSIGWDARAPEKLSIVNSEVLTAEKCARKLKKEIDELSTFFCTSNKDVVNSRGGSGRPAIVNGKQIGIEAYGYGCFDCEEMYVYYIPTSSERVSSFLRETIEKNC